MSLQTDPQPYKISVPEEELNHLHQSLALTRFPDEVDEAGWDYGAPLADVKRIASYWKDGYDWRKHERELNELLPQFTTDVAVDGFGTLNIHFVHKRSERAGAVPLLFLHGWPGSFLEVKKILPLLTASEPRQPSFHVVAPSHPNFGFSQGVNKKGFNGSKYAETAHKLMLALGYTEYVVQGGDWGYLIGRTVANQYGPQYCKAWHTNMPIVPAGTPTLDLTAADEAAMERVKWFRAHGMGYFQLQSTKPQTLGYSLASSPVGLLAWIYEKLHDWTDDYKWSNDEIVTWIMIYWFSHAGPAASARIYYEIGRQEGGIWGSALDRPTVPMGMSIFPREINYLPIAARPLVGEVVFEKAHSVESGGGHFAAYERPEALVADLREMFGKKGGAFGVVKGHDGYESVISQAGSGKTRIGVIRP